MAIELKMPALSPTMEEGTLARWLVKVGDKISSGDIMAEIETDKATMEFEAVDEGILAAIVVEEGTENVAVGTVIAMLAEEGEDVGDVSAPSASAAAPTPASESAPAPTPAPATASSGTAKASPLARRIAANEGVDLGSVSGSGPKGRIVKADVKAVAGGASAPTPQQHGDRVIASPLAKKLAGEKGIDLAAVSGTGPGGRVVKADIDNYVPAPAATAQEPKAAPSAKVSPANDLDAPYEEQKLNNVRKVIARRLTEAKQTVPHIYLTVDIRLDPLLAMRKQLNEALEADGVKLSVNDLIIKALARALTREPQCNVSFQGDVMHQYAHADISVAVAAPSGLITPIIRDAGRKSLSEISAEMKELAGKAREGKLQPHEYQGGTASLSNLGMFGTKQFDAVINPPQGMILAVGAGEQRPHVVDGELTVATVMSATGSFDHRAIDGVDGAKLMDQLRTLIENPMGLVV
ncbi:branched-chain alpha-keto acid dehydrogenase subunit E2 [Erythrobacter longus]|uniref:Dihydrolipoamide acetyltransferase component of pyruvate dehydrogenase complex n=1 Tax=Erythrobacter longus TaxID=1044 RepID=A0A074MF79_ERYLO|nr:2-oxo acid dehydrogenase subunit E2 [Erythrobacter longus]KEO91440.1 branched-chain alpha-keto acid dehydrogenase subunit E2 [Erythrobacter longus]